MSLLGAIRRNWRITMLAVLIAASCFFLFVPGAPIGQALGQEDTNAFGDNGSEDGLAASWTNLQFGIELSGGARIEAPVIGLTAEDAAVEPGQEVQTAQDVAAALEIDVSEVSVSANAETRTVEVFDGSVTESEFETALREANAYGEETTIREGVTSETRSSMIDVLNDRMGEAGFQGGSVREIERGGTHLIRVESPAHDLDDLERIIGDRGQVEVIAHYPGENGTYHNETALRQEHLQDIGTVHYNENRGQYEVDVAVTEERAPEFQQLMLETGIAQDGSQCYYPQKDADGGYGYCQLIVLDGEVVSGLGMHPNLKDSMQSGEWANSQQFVLTSGDAESAEEMRVSLEAGSLQAQLAMDDANREFVSPVLAEGFKTNALLAGVLAVLTVVLVVFLRYGEPRVAAPMSLTALSEVVILLGFAAAIQWSLDLATVAGFIAVVGTGVDDLIIIADEVMQQGDVSSRQVFDNRFSKAFWVIGAAAGTTIVAMSPLVALNLGDLTGFAIVTILGVLIGVFISRPAYGNILRMVKTDK